MSWLMTFGVVLSACGKSIAFLGAGSGVEWCDELRPAPGPLGLGLEFDEDEDHLALLATHPTIRWAGAARIQWRRRQRNAAGNDQYSSSKWFATCERMLIDAATEGPLC
jgi:hypothetical protein